MLCRFCEQIKFVKGKHLPSLIHGSVTSEENLVLYNISTLQMALVLCSSIWFCNVKQNN